jgi:pantoate--beta-alanine ligase
VLLLRFWDSLSRYPGSPTFLISQLEGLTRPHFFRGVATVVTKLFNIVQPERAYFGQKDIQQTIVLKALVRDLHLPIDLRVCPTIRESDGLALSSRNAYLNPDQRDDALVLSQALKAGVDIYLAQTSPFAKTVREAATTTLSQRIDASQGRVSLDYLSLVDSDTLQDLKDADSAKGGVLVGAVFLHGSSRTIRLIDNVILD